jgi:hypothetical protein
MLPTNKNHTAFSGLSELTGYYSDLLTTANRTYWAGIAIPLAVMPLLSALNTFQTQMLRKMIYG